MDRYLLSSEGTRLASRLGMNEALRIWAPRARRVDVVVAGSRIAASPEPGGWWRGPALDEDDDYAVSLDGGPPRPDPRSRWQPAGVHGASRWRTHGTPRAFHPVPLRDAVIYELHVGTFSPAGTFESAIPYLDHLRELGITHLELMPIAQFSGVHGWGYDGVDLFAPHAPYGGPAGLGALIDAAHARGLAVLIDVVHNHLGPEGAYLTEFGPYRTAAHATPWGDAINLDREGSAEVRRFLIESAIGWLRDHGADGLRLDALHALHDDSPRHFVGELVDAVRALERQLGRPFVVIGEWDAHDPRAVIERAAGGWGLDAHWNDDFHHALHALLTGEATGYYADFTGGALAKLLERGYALDGVRSRFRGGVHGRPYGELPRDRLIAYTQSHDQVGNRAAGERLHQLAGIDRARIAAAVLMASPFVPMVFQGEEWATSAPFCYFADLESPALRAAVRDGRRAEHAAAGWQAEPPDPIDPATRAASCLRWSERAEGAHAAMLAWYRELIAIRRREPALRDPSPRATRAALDLDRLVIDRGPLVLVCNLSDHAAPIGLAGEPIAMSAGSSSHRELPPRSCVLIRR